jgi:hypothetical protein
MNKENIICFDLDNTICRTVKSYYQKSKPYKNKILLINQLYARGFYIKIYTARYMGRNNDNVSFAKKKGFKFTENQLKKWNLRYHKLIFGKPSFDILIDDKCIFYENNWETKLLKFLIKKKNS